MSAQYNLISIVIVDRGMIEAGIQSNGQHMMSQHIPYYAGLIIKNEKNQQLEFLDDYNSEILLRKFFGYSFVKPGLKQIIAANIEFLDTHLSKVVTPDIESYLKVNNIKKAPKNANRMNLMGERMLRA